MGKHAGKPANEPDENLVWSESDTGWGKAANFDAYDKELTDNAPEDKSNPYLKENFNK